MYPPPPLLFSLYISDLVTSLNTMNIGVTVGDKTVCVLLYADDIVLLADSVDNLQSSTINIKRKFL